jgi:hypothetical protein
MYAYSFNVAFGALQAHYIRAEKSTTLRYCEAFKASNFWAVTGTPFNTNVADLYNQCRLLRLTGLASAAVFAACVERPWVDQGRASGLLRASPRARAAAVLVALLRSVGVRHSKLQRRHDGSPLVRLPDRAAATTLVALDPLAASRYAWQETAARFHLAASQDRGADADARASAKGLLFKALARARAICNGCDGPDGAALPGGSERFALPADAAARLRLSLGEQRGTIFAATLTAKLAKGDSNFDCPICLEAAVLRPVILPCGTTKKP